MDFVFAKFKFQLNHLQNRWEEKTSRKRFVANDRRKCICLFIANKYYFRFEGKFAVRWRILAETIVLLCLVQTHDIMRGKRSNIHCQSTEEIQDRTRLLLHLTSCFEENQQAKLLHGSGTGRQRIERGCLGSLNKSDSCSNGHVDFANRNSCSHLGSFGVFFHIM